MIFFTEGLEALEEDVPWRLGGHLGGWDESPREMGMGLNQSHENGRVVMGLGTIAQVAEWME